MKLLMVCLCAMGLFFYSCNIINPKEEIPTYIYIDSFTVQSVAPSVHGSTSDRITDAWIYANNELVGAFELPAKIPMILLSDSNSLSVSAGIWDSGMKGTRVRYPFYVLSNHVIGASPGNTIPIHPITQYNTNTKFHIIEDFEQGNSFIKYLNADTTLVKTSDPNFVFKGSNAGLFELSQSGAKGAQSITTQKVNLPQDLQSYMELDYKCNVSFKVRVQITGTNQSVITADLLSINPRENWNKIYINLTELGITYQGRDINFMIEVALPDDQSTGFLAVDNFKVLSF